MRTNLYYINFKDQEIRRVRVKSGEVSKYFEEACKKNNCEILLKIECR